MKSKPQQSKKAEYLVTFKHKDGSVYEESVFLFYKDQPDKAGKELEKKYRGQGNKTKVLGVVAVE